MGYSSIHELLLRYVSKDDLDNILRLCDALGPDPKEYAEMILERQYVLQHLQIIICISETKMGEFSNIEITCSFGRTTNS